MQKVQSEQNVSTVNKGSVAWIAASHLRPTSATRVNEMKFRPTPLASPPSHFLQGPQP